MPRGLVVALLVVSLHMMGASLATAAIVPPPGSVDPRIRVVVYNPEDVVQLQGYVGYQIHIQWAEGEEFVNLGSGDNGAFDVGAAGNHFFIKPKQERGDTNLTILTNRRAYHFEYSVAKPPTGARGSKTMVYSIRFRYPNDEAKIAEAGAERLKAEALLNRSGEQRPRNSDYWFCGSESLKPMQAYDDGVQTHLRFPARSEFPAIFVKNDDGSESLLNFNVEDDDIVIHRVTRRFVLRRGQLVGCVVNQAFTGGGKRPQSNTTVEGIERTTRQVNP